MDGSEHKVGRVYKANVKDKINPISADLLITSHKLRVTIQNVVAENSLDIHSICEKLDIDKDIFIHWLITNDFYNKSRRIITHSDILRFCDYIGIDIRLTLVINKKNFKLEDKL